MKVKRRDRQSPLPCKQVVELITDYLEGALDRRDVARLEVHLSRCTSCAGVLAQFRETIALTGRLRDDALAQLTPERREPLLGAFRAWAAERDG